MNEIKEKLKVFQDFKFFNEDHHYEFKGQRVGISVTRLIEQYCNEFERDLIAERCAKKENKTVQEILNQWQYKNDFACQKGSTCHEFAQSRWSKEKYELDKFDESDEYLEAVLKIQKQAVNFYNDYKDTLEHLYDEFVVGSEEYDIASAIDHLMVNKLTGGLVLIDYKTNSILKGYNDEEKNRKYAKNMKVPLSHIKDLTLNHYYIQLSIYRYLLEKYTNVEVEEMFIVYFSENIENYEIIEIPYLKNEVERILENRRVKNFMDRSIVCLIVGKSGAGKSASLRNFTNDEIGIINVLGKELPFKNNHKTLVTDDYDTILYNAKNSRKKTIVIDDSNYLITREFIRKATLTGYQKFTDMACNYDGLVEGKQDTKGKKIQDGLKDIPGKKVIFMFMHEDYDENGNIVPKTIGKMLDEKINIQGLFTIVIRAVNDNGNYKFILKSNGQDCVKTPIGMFEQSEMENDLKEVNRIIREYYELDKEENKESEEN